MFGIRRWQCLLAVLSACASLFIADLGIRYLMPIPRTGYAACAAYPGSTVDYVSRPDNIRIQHRYNSQGFRGSEFSLDPGTTNRVIAVGDSYTEGSGVRFGETWPKVLGRLLRRNHDVEVLNLGDGGSGPRRYAEIIAQAAVPLKPTHIIVCLIPSDLRGGMKLPANRTAREDLPDPFREFRSSWQKPFVWFFPGLTYVIERIQGKWPVQEGSIWRKYTNRMTEQAARRLTTLEGVPIAEARRIVKRRLESLDSKLVLAARAGEFNPALVRLALTEAWSYRVRASDMDISLDQLSTSATNWLAWYASTARRHGISPWILYFPQPALVVKGPWGPIAEGTKIPDVLGDTSVRDLLMVQAGSLGTGFIDATTILRENAARGLFFRYDTHPTAVAHRLVAEEAARVLAPHLTSHAVREER